MEKSIFSIKLYIIYMLRRIAYIVLGVLIGGACGAIVYYSNVIVNNPKVEYKSEMILDVTYAKDPHGNYQYVFNNAGWSYIIMFDEITDIALENIDIPITKEELKELVTSENIKDYRLLTLRVTSTDPSLCAPILDAYKIAMAEYGENQEEFISIDVGSMYGEPEAIVFTDNTYKAVIGGGIIGLITMMIIFSIIYCFRDVFYIEKTLVEVFSIPVIGTVLKGGQIPFSKEMNLKLEKVAENKNIITISARNDDITAEYKNVDGIIIEVVAEKTSYAQLSRKIKALEMIGCNIVGFMLVEANPFITKMYYR